MDEKCDDRQCLCCRPEMTCFHPQRPVEPAPGVIHECGTCGAVQEAVCWRDEDVPAGVLRLKPWSDGYRPRTRWVRLRRPVIVGPYPQ